MAVQTQYNATQAAAVAGAQATMIPATIISRNVQGAPIGFGKPVAQGTADKSVVSFGGANTKFVGITLLDRSAAGENDTFRVGDSARVITKGDIWVVAAVTVAAGDPVFVTSTGTLTNVGTDNTAITGARFDTSTTANGQLAVVRLG